MTLPLIVLMSVEIGYDGRTLPARDTAEAFVPAEFVARVIMHIPEPRRHLVRYYRSCSNMPRGKCRGAEAENGEVGDTGVAPASRAARAEVRNARALRRSWAQLIKRIYEVDPLVCPSCGSDMKVITFIAEHDVVDAILGHLAKIKARSPRGPPGAATRPATS